MMGAYLKSSPGIRDAGFNAEEGKQFTINLTQHLDNGKINLYTRQTNDHGVWYLPAPLNVDTVDNEYTQIGTNNRQAAIQYGPNNTSETFDFGNGRGWDGSVTGGSIELSFDNGWGLVDRFIYTYGDADTYGLVPNGDPTRLSNVALSGDTATGSVTSREYAGSTMVQQIGRWVVKKQIEAFTNDFILTKTFEDVSVTTGFYHSTFNAKDWWALGNQAYHVVESGGEMLTGIDCNDNLDSCDWDYDINSIGAGTTQALYSAISYEVSDRLTLDIGLRGENHQIEYTVDEGLDTRITKAVSYDESSTAWTVGVNWMLADHMGIFARINDGNKMPYFDDFRDNYSAYKEGDNLIKEVSQYELGYKLVDNNYELFATLFMNEVKGDTFVPQPEDPVQVFTNEAYGIEIDLNYVTDNGLSVSLNSTIQETDITESPLNNGNEAQRQPSWQVRMTPSYDIELSKDMYATLYVTLSAVGDRYANKENSVVLDGYEKVDFG